MLVAAAIDTRSPLQRELMIRVGPAIDKHDDQFIGDRIVGYPSSIIRMADVLTDEHDASKRDRQRRLRCPTRDVFSSMPCARQCCATSKQTVRPTQWYLCAMM